MLSYSIQYGFDIWFLYSFILNTAVGVGLTHAFRTVFNKQNWLILPLYQLAVRISLTLLVLTTIFVLINVPLDLEITGKIALHNPSVFIVYFINLFKPLLIWVMLYLVFHYGQNISLRELDMARLQASVRESESKVLRAQMNPHFMFNALNSIRALIWEDPNKAQQAITQLSNLMRSSLLSDRKKVVSLQEEIQTLENYLSLEKIRYEKRLQVSWDIEPKTLPIEIPPMMLQTLVENAIKHGVQKAIGWGFVDIITRIENNKLYIRIRNTGVLEENTSEKKGFGLENTRQRLQLLYGEESSFRIFQEDANQVCSEIILPVMNDGVGKIDANPKRKS